MADDKNSIDIVMQLGFYHRHSESGRWAVSLVFRSGETEEFRVMRGLVGTGGWAKEEEEEKVLQDDHGVTDDGRTSVSWKHVLVCTQLSAAAGNCLASVKDVQK